MRLDEAQIRRLRRFGVEESADLHCHCLPGLDDGPADLPEALELCQALVRDGITTVVATPHQLGRYDGENSSQTVRHAVARLNYVLGERRVPLRVVPGGDVRIDERLVRLLEDDAVTTIADAGRALLLELPHESYLDPRSLLRQLSQAGMCAVITHPERHAHLQQHPQAVLGFIEEGALLQLTAGSLLGDYGPQARAVAWHWIRKGWVAVVASDAHGARRRVPRMTAAIGMLEREVGMNAARELCLDNPLRLLKGRRAMAAATRWIATKTCGAGNEGRRAQGPGPDDPSSPPGTRRGRATARM